MLIGSKLKELTVGTSTEVTSYKDWLSRICNSSLPEYHLGYCEYCPNEQNLKQMLTDLFELMKWHINNGQQQTDQH
jgi:hypothetical protein